MSRICVACKVLGDKYSPEGKVVLLWDDGTWEVLTTYDRASYQCYCVTPFTGKPEELIRKRFAENPDKYIRPKKFLD